MYTEYTEYAILYGLSNSCKSVLLKKKKKIARL